MKNSIRRWGLLCLSIFLLTNLNAQDYSSEKDRMAAMMAEEQKIEAFIKENIQEKLPEAVSIFVDELLKEGEEHHPEITVAEKQQLLEQVRRKYFRHVYMLENPESASLYEAEAVGNCMNGDFEMGDFTSYGAASGLRPGTIADCDIASILFTPEPPQTVETVSAGGGINCAIVSVGNDPIIPTLPMVHSGTYAARINQNSWLYGVNQITKKVVLTQPNEDIGFWFSLVMQNPNGHNNQQPFFKARALDPMGGVLDEVCEFADATNPFFGSTIVGSEVVVHSPYFCQTLELSGNVGDTITLEISTADCGAGGHWGYSYVDDICDVCVVDSCNYQGDVNLDPTDTCSDITQVCGTYNLAALNCSTATVHDITLDIYQGGSIINTLTGPTIDLVNQTFCFNISPADFLGNTGGFDFQANITFNINGSFTTESDLNTNPGQDNDYLTDPDCCPEFEILDCCTYWNLPAATESSERAVQDETVARVLAEYSEKIQSEFGRSLNSSDCDPCDFPGVSFPIFIVDENNMLIDDSYYSITWSHNPGWTAAYSWILPNEQTIVTVYDSINNCTWTDTFYYDCCEFEVEIVPLCTTCDPCSNPNQPFFLITEDQDGNALSTTGYTFIWNTTATSSGINGVVNTVYTVTVTELATGCVSTDTFSIDCCQCDIDADFDFKIDQCKVEFMDKSTMDSCNTIVSYAWDFGDGNTSTLANPVHIYSGNGSYTACLIITATTGTETCSDTICKEVIIDKCDQCPCDLKPDFKFEVEGCTVRFDGDAGADDCLDILGYKWDFGDGNTSSLEDPTHSYLANGVYEVCLVVYGTNGQDTCEEKICYEVEITDCDDCPCEVKADFKYDVQGCDVRFDGDAGANECTQVLQYYWDFGDGNNSALEDPTHTYAANGTYTVCLTVEGTNGIDHCKSTTCYEVSIEECKDCECKVEANFLSFFGIKDPCTVFFSDLSTTNSCTNITGYRWDFGDGTISTLANPSHTYSADGSYTVCLTVYGQDGFVGCYDTFCRKINISGCSGIGIGISPAFKKGSTSDSELNDFEARVYPNPFNNEFSITFNNSLDQKVSIRLIDSRGTEIKMLSEEVMNEGQHKLDFNASDLQLTSGIYFIHISSDAETSYRKIVYRK